MFAITGASGNTGRVIADTLLAKGEEVRVIGRSKEKLERFASKGAEVFVGDAKDSAAMTKAFSGARAVYAMIAPDHTVADLRADQEQTTDSLAAAIEKSGVSHVICLSSVGADKPERVGPVNGLHSLEQKIQRIANLNALFLRPTYFMENNLIQIKLIQSMGTMGGLLKADAPLRADRHARCRRLRRGTILATEIYRQVRAGTSRPARREHGRSGWGFRQSHRQAQASAIRNSPHSRWKWA